MALLENGGGGTTDTSTDEEEISTTEHRLLEGSLSTTEETAERLFEGSLESDADPRLGSEVEATEDSTSLIEQFTDFATRNVDEGGIPGTGGLTEDEVTEQYEQIDEIGQDVIDFLTQPGPFTREGGIIDTTVATADHLAGSVDESIARQFDDESGGGFVDETIRVVTDTGSGAIQAARNIGPDWLDEATIGLAVIAVLVLLAPYAELGAAAAEGR